MAFLAVGPEPDVLMYRVITQDIVRPNVMPFGNDAILIVESDSISMHRRGCWTNRAWRISGSASGEQRQTNNPDED